jgi:carbamoyl-phosphate synthase large subunit
VAKRDDFADKYLAKLLSIPEAEIRLRRCIQGIVEVWEPVPVSGARNQAYYYFNL